MLHIGTGTDRFFSLTIIATLALAALCFTPLVTMTLRAAGLAEMLFYADVALFALLACSVGAMLVAYLEWRGTVTAQVA